MAIAWKLPGFAASVGTAAQPAPNVVAIIEADGLGAAAVVVATPAVGAEAVSVSSEPQAATEKANSVAAAIAVSLVARMG
jgi:hypothetical protein